MTNSSSLAGAEEIAQQNFHEQAYQNLEASYPHSQKLTTLEHADFSLRNSKIGISESGSRHGFIQYHLGYIGSEGRGIPESEFFGPGLNSALSKLRRLAKSEHTFKFIAEEKRTEAWEVIDQCLRLLKTEKKGLEPIIKCRELIGSLTPLRLGNLMQSCPDLWNKDIKEIQAALKQPEKYIQLRLELLSPSLSQSESFVRRISKTMSHYAEILTQNTDQRAERRVSRAFDHFRR